MQQSASVTPTENNFSSVYEDIRQRFNRFADDRGLKDQINAFLVAEIEAGQFDHAPYIRNLVLDCALLASDKLNLDIVRTGLDYHADYQNHQASAAFERRRTQLSDNLIATIKLLGPPHNYNEALAQQKLILQINPHFLDPHHYEVFNHHREELKLHITRFAQHALVQRLDRIENENKTIQTQQDNTLRSLDEFRRLGQSTSTALSRVEQTMPHKAQVDALMQRLQQQGIQTNDQLYALLNQNELLRHDMENVLSYIEDERREKFKRVAEERKAANYQGLTDACHFMGELGKVSGCRELSTLAGITQAGVQIHRAVNQIMTAGLSGAALLGPYAAIGMAVLGVFSMFRRSPDPHRIIMKQLVRLSQQITALHKDMTQHFKHLDERLSFIFEKMQEGFTCLQMNMTLSVSKRLAEIQSQLEMLSRITKEGFQEMLLKDLKANITYISDVKEEISDNQMSQTMYEERLRNLREFALEKSCSPLLNGTVYCPLLEPRASNTAQLIALLHNRDAAQLEGLIGLLATFARNDLKITELQSIDLKQIFHPRLWRIAVEAYCDLKKIGDGKFTYDPKNINFQKLRAQLENQLKLMYQLLTNKNFYQAIFLEIEQQQQQLQEELRRISGNTRPVASDTQQITFEVPSALRDSNKCVAVTKQFFAKGHLLTLLHQLTINIPDEFLQAAQLGLGYFEYRMHMPASLRKKHHQKDGHKGKYRHKEGENAGLEINFVLEGQKIPLFKPGLTHKGRFGKLKAMYQHLIQYCTQQVYTINTCAQISQVIKEQGSNTKKQFAQRVALALNESSAYHRLLRLNHCLLAYLVIAGFTKQQIESLASKLLLKDLVGLLEEYTKNPCDSIMPILQLASLEEIRYARDAVLADLTNLQTGLLLSQELLLLQDVLPLLPAHPADANYSLHCAFFQNQPPSHAATAAATTAPSTAPNNMK